MGPFSIAAVIFVSSFGRLRLYSKFTLSNKVGKFTGATSAVILLYLLLMSQITFPKRKFSSAVFVLERLF